jgi:hypothetical protein
MGKIVPKIEITNFARYFITNWWILFQEETRKHVSKCFDRA